MMFDPRRPMTLQEAQALSQRVDRSRQQIASNPMPTTLQDGMTQLGASVGNVIAQQRLRSQFPNGVPGMPAPQPPPIQRFAETISGNKMPWQFPQAPGALGSEQAPKPIPAFSKPGGLFGLW